LPFQESLSKTAKDMIAVWSQLFDGKPVEEFKARPATQKQFAATVVDASEPKRRALMEIMMARFQDITGQIIKKVVTITRNWSRNWPSCCDNAPASVAAKNKPVDLMAGPAVPDRRWWAGRRGRSAGGLGF